MSLSDSNMLQHLTKSTQKKCVIGIYKYNLVRLCNFTLYTRCSRWMQSECAYK